MYKNVIGTSDLRCNPCQSWLNHWSKLSLQSIPVVCQKLNCSTRGEVGAHVQHIGGGDVKILPLCSACNSLSTPFHIKNALLLVSSKPC